MVFAVYISMGIGSCKAKPCMERTRYPCSYTLGKVHVLQAGQPVIHAWHFGEGLLHIVHIQ